MKLIYFFSILPTISSSIVYHLILLIWKQWKNTIPSDFNVGILASCSQSLKIGHWAGSVSTVPQEHGTLFVLLPCHCQYVAFHDCQRLLNLQVLHPHSRSEKPSPIWLYSIFSEKEATPRDSTPPHCFKNCVTWPPLAQGRLRNWEVLSRYIFCPTRQNHKPL